MSPAPGSWAAWPLPAVLIPFYMLRLVNEELPGYCEYCRRTRFRLIPFLW